MLFIGPPEDQYMYGFLFLLYIFTWFFARSRQSRRKCTRRQIITLYCWLSVCLSIENSLITAWHIKYDLMADWDYSRPLTYLLPVLIIYFLACTRQSPHHQILPESPIYAAKIMFSIIFVVTYSQATELYKPHECLNEIHYSYCIRFQEHYTAINLLLKLTFICVFFDLLLFWMSEKLEIFVGGKLVGEFAYVWDARVRKFVWKKTIYAAPRRDFERMWRRY